MTFAGLCVHLGKVLIGGKAKLAGQSGSQRGL